MVAAYTPTYYDEAVGLPAPEGIYGKEVHSTKTGAAQINLVLAILTILLPSEPIKCSKEAVCQLRPCFMGERALHLQSASCYY